MNNARGFLFLATVLSAACTTSSYTVHHVDPDKPVRADYNRVYYTLPRSVLTIEAPVTKIDVTPGECKTEYLLAAQLGIPKKALTQNDTTVFKLGALVLGSRSEPDPKAVFGIELKRKTLQKLTQEFALSESGFLQTGKGSQENQSIALAETILTTAASVVGAVIKTGATLAPTAAEQKSRCEQIAESIIGFRERRLKLILGENPIGTLPKDTLETMLTSIDAAEQELVANFTGSVEKKISTVRCEYLPEKSTDSVDLFTFTPNAGVQGQHSLCVVPAAAVGTGNMDDSKIVQLTIARGGSLSGGSPQTFPDTVERAQRELTSAEGLFYRIPGNALVKLTVGNDAKVLANASLPQFGILTALPGGKDAKSFKSSFEVAFYPDSGAIKTLNLSGESGGNTIVSTAGSAVTSVLTAKQEREAAQAAAKAAEAAAKDELAQLERTRKILEEQKKIKDLQQALAGGN